MDILILKDVSKKFRRDINSESFLSSIYSKFQQIKRGKEFFVLRDISFNVKKREIIGVIGDNGSGKSTLLRVIAGIYKTDKGSVRAKGNIISLINLHIGLQQMLTMKENIYLVCAFFGLDREEIKKRFNDIIELSELRDYVNTKLYKFSNGMLQRLIFSVAIHCDPEILLLDEVFEFGDKEFGKKSVKKIMELVNNGCSIVLVSHDMDLIKRNCKRVIWLEKGKIKKEGEPKKIVGEYLNSQ